MPQNDGTDAPLSLLTLCILPVVLCATGLGGCSFVRVKDGEWCGPGYDGGANCVHMLTSESRDMTDKEFMLWLKDPIEPKLCGSVDAFTAQKSAVEELCAQAKNCIYLVPDPSPLPSPVSQ